MIYVKRLAPFVYTGYVKPRTRKPLIDQPRFASNVEDGACCTDCGWPVGSAAAALRSVTADGDKAFKHLRCPSLSERARLRKEFLEMA